MVSLTTRQRRVLAECIRVASRENCRFPLLAADLSRFVSAVETGAANGEEMEAAVIIAAHAPHAQPETSSPDWRVLVRTVSKFNRDPTEAYPYWRDLVQHHLSIGAYAR